MTAAEPSNKVIGDAAEGTTNLRAADFAELQGPRGIDGRLHGGLFQ